MPTSVRTEIGVDKGVSLSETTLEEDGFREERFQVREGDSSEGIGRWFWLRTRTTMMIPMMAEEIARVKGKEVEAYFGASQRYRRNKSQKKTTSEGEARKEKGQF